MGREMGGRFKREGIYVYLSLIHVEFSQKTTEFCKAIILQKRSLKKRKITQKEKKLCRENIKYTFIKDLYFHGRVS